MWIPVFVATVGAALLTYASSEREHEPTHHRPVRATSMFIMAWLLLFVLAFWLSSAMHTDAATGTKTMAVCGGGSEEGWVDERIVAQIPMNVSARVGQAPF